MNPEDLLLDGESQFVKVRASQGTRSTTPARGGKLTVTEHRTLFCTKRGFESIAHNTLNGITVTKHTPDNTNVLVAALLAVIGLGVLGTWAITIGNFESFDSILYILGSLVAFGGTLYAYTRTGDYYETLELHLPTGTKQFSANEEDAFSTASKIIAQSWKRRDPKF